MAQLYEHGDVHVMWKFIKVYVVFKIMTNGLLIIISNIFSTKFWYIYIMNYCNYYFVYLYDLMTGTNNVDETVSIGPSLCSSVWA